MVWLTFYFFSVYFFPYKLIKFCDNNSKHIQTPWTIIVFQLDKTAIGLDCNGRLPIVHEVIISVVGTMVPQLHIMIAGMSWIIQLNYQTIIYMKTVPSWATLSFRIYFQIIQNTYGILYLVAVYMMETWSTFHHIYAKEIKVGFAKSYAKL